VAAERLKAKLSVHENDGVAGLEEVLGGRCPAGTWPDDDNPFRNRETIDALASNPPALKLSRKRTLDVTRGGWNGLLDTKPTGAKQDAHTLSSNGTVVPPLFGRERGLSRQGEGGGDAYGHKHNFPSQIPLSMYEGSDVSYVAVKGRWGRLCPKVRFGREQGRLGIQRGHDRTTRTVEWS
jgi:hypothetical protein